MKQLTVVLSHFLLLFGLISCEKENIDIRAISETSRIGGDNRVNTTDILRTTVGNIFGVSPNKSSIFRYNGSPNNWSKIGGPGADWVWADGKLYGLSPRRDGVYEYDDFGLSWSKVGGPTHQLYRTLLLIGFVGYRFYSFTTSSSMFIINTQSVK